jgi:high-affinity iron transporter
LMEFKRRAPAVLGATASAADKRRAEWGQRREKMWMTAVVATSFVFIFLSTAEFIYAKSSTALSPTSAVTLVGSQVTLPTADVNDDKLHRYGVHIDDGKGGNVEIRFLLFKKPDGNIVTVADACQICGPVGFYIGDQGITCKMCASPLNAGSMGQKGGCNPIPLRSTVGGGQVVIQAADLRELAPVFER